jgi:hypothetical protein
MCLRDDVEVFVGAGHYGQWSGGFGAVGASPRHGRAILVCVEVDP